MKTKTTAIIAGVVALAIGVSLLVSLSVYYANRAKNNASADFGGAGNLSAAASLNKLALDLFTLVAAGKQNTFLSPASIAAALGMLRVGATPDSRTDAELFRLTGGALNLSSVVGGTEGDRGDGVSLVIANSLWADEQRARRSYIDKVQVDFGADVGNVPSDVSVVNEWAREKTQGGIEKVLSDFPAQTGAILVNALLFRGTWREEFEKTDTKTADFLSNGTKTVPVQMMNRKNAHLWYASVAIGKDCFVKIAEVPYGQMNRSLEIGSDEFTAVMILPCEGQSLDSLLGELGKPHAWDSWLGKLSPSPITASVLSIPRFTLLTQPTSYKRALRKLGVQAAFDGEKGGGFSNMMSDPSVVVSDVVHTAKLEVNEQGTTASASTGITVADRSAAADEHPDLVLNRSFVFAIRNRKSSAIIFIGRLDDPSLAPQ